MKAAINALADGIECGAKLRPQVLGSLCESARNEAGAYVYGSCALGAAYECALMKDGKSEAQRIADMRAQSDYDEILALYGVVDRTADQLNTLEDCGITWEGESQAVSSTIYRLNDLLGWSREKIAAFLRELE